jgi:hypothetical protein
MSLESQKTMEYIAVYRILKSKVGSADTPTLPKPFHLGRHKNRMIILGRKTSKASESNHESHEIMFYFLFSVSFFFGKGEPA